MEKNKDMIEITVVEYMVFESEDRSISEVFCFPMSNEKLEELIQKFEGHTFSIKTAFSNWNMILGRNNKEIRNDIFNNNNTMFKLKNLKCDESTYQKLWRFNVEMRAINYKSNIKIVGYLADFVTRDIEEICDIVEDGNYTWVDKEDLQYIEYEEMVKCNKNLTIIKGEEGTLFLYDDRFCNRGITNFQYPIEKKDRVKEYEDDICSICGEPYYGLGKNASPINDGRCCDYCNSAIVLPIRIFNSEAYKRIEMQKETEKIYN